MAPPPGYQIVEPPSLGTVIAIPSQQPLAVAVLTWVIDRAKSQFEYLSDELSVEVICVTFVGSYPAVGVRYLQENPQDRGPEISDAIDAVMRSMSVADFVSFAEKSKVNWCDAWQRMRENKG